MLTKIKKLFSKNEDNNSEKELMKNDLNTEKILEKETNKTESEKPEFDVQQIEPTETEMASNDLKAKEDAMFVNSEADSLAIKSEPDSSAKKEEITKEHSIEEIKEEVIKVLKTCYDPEIPVDVWELGLIYDIKVATNGDVMIVMTLTSPSCPVAGILPGEIEQKVKEHPMVNDSKVQLTFDPPWSQKNMSEVANLELGFL